jgi:hypothetical protein
MEILLERTLANQYWQVLHALPGKALICLNREMAAEGRKSQTGYYDARKFMSAARAAARIKPVCEVGRI